ncbi:PREDICTED: cytochrome P450 2F3-like [Nanorana parkeri]|uniref:cytochrome P450 2F3-like n=1 Tax=Nanorana parkeri TaxID=125878 RepID=UPI0008543315|nr:PREDICTED: cytochrome P450 2F3-like [Nanorana parkeri]
MDWYGTLVLTIFFCVSCIILSFLRILREKASLPPGPMPLPLIGNLLQIDTKDIGSSLMKLKDKYGPVYSLYLGPRPGIVLCGYNAVKEALIDQSEVFGDRGDYPVFLNFIGEHDLCFTNGERWKTLRRFALLTLRNFGMGKRSVEERIQEEAQFLIKEFKKANGAPVNPTNYFARTVSNVICSIVFGSRFDYEDKRLLAITDSIYYNFLIMSSTWGTLYNMYPGLMEYLPGPHKKIGKYFNMIYDISAESIKQHKETLDPENPRDYIDCFLMKIKEEADNPDTTFYAKSLARTIQNLLFGGTETVSTNLRYGFLVLMKYPEVAEKMQEEIDRVIGRNRLPSISDRSNMPYTEAAIHELIRFCDVLPVSLPRATSRGTQYRGYSIPKGTHVTPLLASVHRDPDHYAQPEEFNPNHFLDGKGLFKKNDAHMPFGAGKRMCPGESLGRMELFLYFTSLLQYFTFKPVIPKEEIDLKPTGSGLGNVPPYYKCCIIPR